MIQDRLGARSIDPSRRENRAERLLPFPQHISNLKQEASSAYA